jgi:CheY-like chemotaxis protein
MAKTILIIDDDTAIRQFLDMLFCDNGYETLQAGNGAEALAILETRTPDLITLDIEMPEITGPKFNRLISRQQGKADIPIVVITGHTGLKYVIPTAVASLTKPFDSGELLAVVRETIGA